MAKLLTGTRIYGTGTVDTQLIINGTGQAVSTNSGALQVVGGVGIAGSLVVGGVSTFTNQIKTTGGVNAATTLTGDIVVAGGIGVGGDVRVGGTLYGTIQGTVVGTITTATNLAAGTAGQIPYQNAPGVTQFFGPGSTGTVLIGNGAAAPSFISTSSLYVGRSMLADDLAGGAAGSLPYQNIADDTTFLGIGASGTILQSNGSAPQWASTSSLVVGKASNADGLLLSNDTVSATAQYIAFVSTTTGYTTVKGSAMSGLTYIPNSGLFGVGTGAPAYRLHVVETSDVVPAQIERPLGGDTLQLYNSSGLTTNFTQLAFLHKDSANAAVTASRIAGYANSVASGAVSGGIIFYSRNAGTQDEAVRINHLGNVGLGNNDPAYRLDVSGGARITGITTVTDTTVASSPTTGALQVSGGAGIAGNVISGGQFSSTRANSTATGSGQIYLNGATGNRIDFATAGSGAPTLTTRSVGTKIVFNPQLSPTTSDFAIGIESGSLWTGVSSASDSFKWYAANTEIASLSGGGSLTLNGDISVNGGDIVTNQSTFNLLDETATNINFGRAATAITIGNNVSGTTTIRNNLAVTTNTNSTAYTNGALAVTGGVGIGGDLRVNGTIYGTVSVTGVISTATNLANGTAGQLVYQVSPGITGFYGPGTAGDVLISNGTSGPLYSNTLALSGTTAASSPTTGALRVAGGAGVNGALYVGDLLNVASTGAFAGDVTVGSTSRSTSSFVRVLAGDASNAGFEAYGNLQGTGYVYVGQANTIGGGMFYNGDGSPTFATNELADNITFYRQSGVGTKTAVFYYSYLSDNVTFRGDIAVNGGDITTNVATFNLVDANATTVNFARAATALTIGAASGTTTVQNNLTVAGNLTVQGTTTQVNSTVTNVSDPIFTIGGGAGGIDPAADDNKDRGIQFKWHNGTAAKSGFFGYDDSTGYFSFVPDATLSNEVVSGTRGAIDANLAGGTTGSLPYQSAANTTAFLSIGSNGQILTVSGGLPSWADSTSITVGTASQVSMVNDVASTTPQFVTFVSTSTGAATVKASAMSGLTYIPSTSYLGIGQGTPSYPLHINVPAGLASIGMSGTATNATTYKVMQGVTSVSNGGFSLYDVTNSATRFMIGSTGNVGIGTGTQDPVDRLHISNSGGAATLRVGDSAGIAAGIIVQRTNGGVNSLAHYYLSSANSPWQHWGENLTWTGERAGTVNTTHAYKPYYEAYAPATGYREFGFVNVTSGAFTGSNMVSSLTLKNDGTNGINTTTPTDFLNINAKAASATNYGITLQDTTVNAVNQTTGIKFKWNTANAADIKSILTNATTGAAALTFGTSNDGSTISERMRIAQGGNVGIGEQDPASYSKLTVRISSNTGVGAGGSGAIWLQNANGANNNAASIFFGDDPANAMGAINFVHSNYVSNYGEITFDTRGSAGYVERMRIDTLGNVGIAKSAANAKLNVLGNVGIDITDTSTSSALMDSNATNNAIYVRAPFNSNPAALSNAGAKWGMVFSGGPSADNTTYPIIASTSTLAKAASIYAVSEDAGAGYNRKVGLGFWTSDQDLAQVERIRIAGTGNVGVGTTSPSRLLDVNGTFRANGAATITGATSITNTTQATSTATGALIVTGGVGIGGNLHVGGTIVGTFSGAISGSATTASNVVITNDSANASTHYLTFVDGAGNKGLKIDASELSFIPSSNRLGIGTNAPGYTLDVRGEIYTSGSNTWFAGATSYMRSNNVFEFLNNSGNAQTGKFKSIQVSTSYSGTIPDDGILFGTDSNLYRSAATTLRTNSSVIVDGSLGVGTTSPAAKIQSTGATATTTPTSGSATGSGLYITNTDTAYGMMFGVAGSGRGWIQQQRSDATGTQYDLSLNPIGGNVGVGVSAPGTRLTVQASGANGIAILQDTGATANSGRLFFQASGGTYAITNVGNTLQFASGSTVGSDTGTSRMVLNSSGYLGLGTTQVPVTYLDIRHNNNSTQSSQVSGFTLRTSENNGMEWHLQHTNGYQGWVAAARVNNNGNGWGQGYLEFITAGSGGGNQVSTMALHGNGNVSIGSTAAPSYKLFVNGSFAATTKSFVIDHPIKAGWKLRYASLEGPENGVYIRGRLKDHNVIELPDYWRELVDIDSISVDITPVGKYQKLYVQEVRSTYIVIATESDMSVNCYYTVWAERKDVGKLVVEYEE